MDIRKFLKETSKSQMTAFVSICLIYGLHGTVFNSIPFMFYRPQMMCSQEGNDQLSLCSEERMCEMRQMSSSANPTMKYSFESINDIQSIPIEYDLFCDRKIIEAQIQTLSTIGQLCGFILSLLWTVPAKKKLNVILATLYSEAICLISLMIIDSLSMVYFTLFIQNFCFSYFYAILFIFVAEYFSSTVADVAPILTNFLWAFTMLIYVVYAYNVVYWRYHIAFYSGVPLLIMTGIFHYLISGTQLYQSEDEDEKYKQSNQNQEFNNQLKEEKKSFIGEMIQQITEIRSDPQQYTNLCVYILCNSGCYVSYFGVYLALNRLEGNIYVNSFVSTLFELSGGISAAILIARFKNRQILFYTYLLIAFSYTSCIIFQNSSVISSTGIIGRILSLLPIIVSKATHEMLFPIFIIFLPKILHQKYHQFAFAIANLVGVLTMNVLPFFQYFMEKYELNQFLGYGLFIFMVAFQIGKIHELDSPEHSKKVKGQSNSRGSPDASENGHSEELKEIFIHKSSN